MPVQKPATFFIIIQVLFHLFLLAEKIVMAGTLSEWNDTIVALATPQGMGAIAVIRLSGQRSLPLVNELFPAKNLLNQKSHTLHVGYLYFEDVALDEVVVALYKGPASYTGEDVVEISCHGSIYIQQRILQSIQQSGARLAKPGEFTLRAFLNGKMDLAQAEAVADIIASNTEASQRTALRQMRGGFSGALQEIREELLQFSALIELELDFSQEDVEFADRKKLYTLLNAALAKVDDLLQSFLLGNVIRNGVQVAIIGKPNAGKSTLLNRLLNDQRAIVSEIPGTTRDTIEEVININGILFRLIDTAGLREHTTDVIEQMGIEKSLATMRNAGIVLYLFDVSNTSDEELLQQAELLTLEQIAFILVGNKMDDPAHSGTLRKKYSTKAPLIFISSKNNLYINDLKEWIFNSAVSKPTLSEQTIVTNARHAQSLEKVSTSLKAIVQGLNDKLPGDLLALDIKTCLYHLGEITGAITNEDQLDYIFSKFCIGK